MRSDTYQGSPSEDSIIRPSEPAASAFVWSIRRSIDTAAPHSEYLIDSTLSPAACTALGHIFPGLLEIHEADATIKDSSKQSGAHPHPCRPVPALRTPGSTPELQICKLPPQDPTACRSRAPRSAASSRCSCMYRRVQSQRPREVEAQFAYPCCGHSRTVTTKIAKPSDQPSGG